MRTNKKIITIIGGCGAIGTTIINSAIVEGIADEYRIIDLDNTKAEGHKLDYEDSLILQGRSAKVLNGGYELLDGTNILIITAGAAQKDGETRFDLLTRNVNIIKSIATSVKKTKFNGITLIVCNPVDIMATIYQKITNYDPKKVIGTSCFVDTNRFLVELSSKLNVNPKSINAFVIGEHGDSSVVVFSSATIGGQNLEEYAKERDIKLNREEIGQSVREKAYKIISGKGSTTFGISATTLELVKTIFNDEKKVYSVAKLFDGEFGYKGIYSSIPCVIGEEGIIESINISLDKKEEKQYKNSLKILKDTFNTII